jgi:hypothetical protein
MIGFDRRVVCKIHENLFLFIPTFVVVLIYVTCEVDILIYHLIHTSALLLITIQSSRISCTSLHPAHICWSPRVPTERHRRKDRACERKGNGPGTTRK